MLIQELKHKDHIRNSRKSQARRDQVKIERTITSRKRLESRVCKFRIL